MTSTETPDYRAIASELSDAWGVVLSSSKLVVHNDSRYEADKAIRVLGLANHVFLAGRASLDLLADNAVVVAIPTIRTGYECALTAMWISQSTPDAVQGWLAQDPAMRRAMRKTLEAASTPGLRLIANKVVGTDALGVESNSTLQAESISEMLQDFEGGGDLYAFYRYLCGFTHASPSLTDEYARLDDSPGSIGYELLTEPKSALDRSIHVHAVATTMLWALSAVRFIHKAKMTALRSQLQASARALGSPIAFDLNAKARARQGGRAWGTAKPISGKTLRIAAKAKGLEYAFSPGTGSDNPAHYVWRSDGKSSAPKVFGDVAEAAGFIASMSSP